MGFWIAGLIFERAEIDCFFLVDEEHIRYPYRVDST